MKRTAAILVMSIAFVTCASSDVDEPPQRRGRGAGRAGAQMEPPSATGLNIIPLTDWWREPSLSSALNLSSEQYASLDRIASDQREEIARLERDSATAMRDLRQSFDTDPATIIAAADRARSLHDNLFDREVRMLAAERRVLTDAQWRTLQQQIAEQRMDRREDYGRSRSGRRGGMGGGRGRWPGF